ncbi:uncharacterized protein [Centruroides vittatus]|uniref:uncharacterized protein n=1 Tax=Centruroides vittatus TaxID=120091 RepID=UPI00350FDB2A
MKTAFIIIILLILYSGYSYGQFFYICNGSEEIQEQFWNCCASFYPQMNKLLECGSEIGAGNHTNMIKLWCGQNVINSQQNQIYKACLLNKIGEENLLTDIEGEAIQSNCTLLTLKDME